MNRDVIRKDIASLNDESRHNRPRRASGRGVAIERGVSFREIALYNTMSNLPINLPFLLREVRLWDFATRAPLPFAAGAIAWLDASVPNAVEVVDGVVQVV